MSYFSLRWSRSCMVLSFLIGAVLLATAPDLYAAENKVTIDEQAILLPDLLTKIAEEAGVQLIMTPGIEKTVPVANFKDKPWDEVMKQIVSKSGFHLWIEGNCAVVSKDNMGMQPNLEMIPDVGPDTKISLLYDRVTLPVLLDKISEKVGVSILMLPGRGEDLITTKLPGRRILSVNIKDVHWRKVLEIVARSAGCTVQSISDAGNVYVVKAVDVVLKVSNRPVGEVLRDISEQSGINIVVSPNVKGSVTVSLDGVPWAEALDAIVTSLGLAWRQHSENTIMVTGEPRTLTTMVSFFDINYISGDQMEKALNAIDPEGEYEDSTGLEPPWVLVLNAEPHIVREVEKLLAEYDRPSVSPTPLEVDLSQIQLALDTPSGKVQYDAKLSDEAKARLYRKFKNIIAPVLSDRGETAFLPVVDRVMIRDTHQNLAYVQQIVSKEFPPFEKIEPDRELFDKEYAVEVASSEDMAKVIRAIMAPSVKVEALEGAIAIKATLREHKKVQELLSSYDVDVERREFNILYAQIDSLASLLKSRLSPLAIVETDPLTKTIIIEAPQPDQRYTERFLRVQDVPPDEAISVKVFKLNFAKADELAGTLKSFLQSTADFFSNAQSTVADEDSDEKAPEGVTDEGSDDSEGASEESSGKQTAGKSLTDKIEAVVLADTNSNSLIVTARGADMPKIQDLIDRLDREPLQVLVIGRVIETTVYDLKDIGLDINLAGSISGASVPTTMPFDKRWTNGYDELVPDHHPDDIGTGSSDDYAANRLFAYPDADLFSSFGMLNFGALSVTLKMLDEARDTRLISSPRIVILDNNTAKFKVSESWEYRKRGEVTTGDGGQVAFSYQYATAEDKISLEVTPQITPNGKILMDLKPEINTFIDFDIIVNPDGTEDKLPIQVIRETETKVIVDDGMTLVLAGLVKNWGRNNDKRVPFLGRIPGLGRLFRSELDETSDRNLLIFITPIIMKSDASHSRKVTEIRSAYDVLEKAEKNEIVRWESGRAGLAEREPAKSEKPATPSRKTEKNRRGGR